ncbi:exported hypothetical protein [Thiomonas sp. X19]|uniref:WD40/YVTN/BNR-like repeat-containing protein n=1 Tax=Thiomonas sp. X19 TaxID=1050370 RepID=UPI000B7135C9|nr:hypothetical protein [Thiomonas sp. X19]SCC91262.1 exported hypothetical protein [Thiomonas sp. X19]
MHTLKVVRVIAAWVFVSLLAACGGGGGGTTPGTATTSGTGSTPSQAPSPGGSTLGIVWTSFSPPPGGTSWNGVAFGNKTWAAVGSGVTGYSTNGSNWTSMTVSTSDPSYAKGALTFANGLFMATSEFGVSTSTDGVTWLFKNLSNNSGSNPEPQGLAGIAFGNNTWVAVDNRYLTDDFIAFEVSSNNGANWTYVTTPMPYAQPASVAFGNGKFVAVGYGSFVATSANGTTWTKQSLGFSDGLTSVTFGNNLFVAVGSLGDAYSSPDGVTWTKTLLSSASGLSSICFGNNEFVAVGGIHTSSDGNTWTARSLTQPVVGGGTLSSVAFGNNQFIAVGGSTFTISQ